MLCTGRRNAAYNGKARTDLSGQEQWHCLARVASLARSVSGGEDHLVDLVDEVAEVEGLGEDLGILGRL